jgi:hypothetical protein
MDVKSLKGYGVAASDAEGGWSSETKKKLRSLSSKVVLSNLSLIQKFSFTYHFIQEKKRAKSIDLSSIRAKGMTNDAFLSQQLEYLALYSALKKTVGYDDAQNIALRIMDATAREALLASAPSQEEVRNIGEPFDVYKSYFEVMPDSARKAGCHEMSIYENSENVFQFDIHYCVWFELAKLFEVPEACVPNCYADDLAYPDYFDSLGIKYSRTGTLANGSTKCDFRFERK